MIEFLYFITRACPIDLLFNLFSEHLIKRFYCFYNCYAFSAFFIITTVKAFNGTFIITVVNAYSIFIFTVVSLLLQLIYIIALSLIISALPTNCGFCLVCKAVLKHMSHLCSRTCLGGQQGILGNLIVLS